MQSGGGQLRNCCLCWFPPTGAKARGPGPLPWAGASGSHDLWCFTGTFAGCSVGIWSSLSSLQPRSCRPRRAARSFLQGWWPLLQYLGAEVSSPANLGSEFGCKLINYARTFFSPDGLSLVICASKNLKSSHFHVHNMGKCEQNKGTMRHMKVFENLVLHLFKFEILQFLFVRKVNRVSPKCTD